MTTNCLAIIPARGGSKSIPGKNIAVVGGRPLLAWTISAAKLAKSVDRLILTTDDPDIAEVGRQYGAEVPFLRPSSLARDDTPGIAPILHAVNWLDQHEQFRPEYVVLLQPTSPLRRAEDIDGAVQLARERRAEAVVSVCPVHHHPYWMKRITSDGTLVDFLVQDYVPTCRQNLPPLYALNGAIYLVRREVLLDRRKFYTDHTLAYVMPLDYSLDVDTSWDLYLVDLILKNCSNYESR